MKLVPQHVRRRFWRGHQYRDVHAEAREAAEALGFELETAPEFTPDLAAPRHEASWQPLLAALRELGERELPGPEAPGLRPLGGRELE